MMIPTPKRRWFRFSLRTLLVATALVAGTVGSGLALRARAERLTDRAGWHDKEASRFSFSARMRRLGFPGTEERETARQAAEQAIADDHKTAAAACRRAVWRPWIQVKEPQYTRQPAIRMEP